MEILTKQYITGLEYSNLHLAIWLDIMIYNTPMYVSFGFVHMVFSPRKAYTAKVDALPFATGDLYAVGKCARRVLSSFRF